MIRLPAIRCIAAGLALALATGCTKPAERRRVEVHLLDLVHASAAPVKGSTAAYPTATLGDQTRPVVLGRSKENVLTTVQASVKVSVPENARLELGYALESPNPLPAAVGFTVTARDGASVRTLLDREVTAGSADAEIWHDASVELSGVHGEVVLEFSTATAAGGSDPTLRRGAAAYFSDPVITAPDAAQRSAAGQPRNLILISLDTLRADHLSVYGYERQTSPEMDRIFSSEGVVVERAYTNAADTLRDHAAMLTGFLPVTALSPSDAIPHLTPWVLTLAEHLRAAGYRTAAFTEDAWLGASPGFARGFELYDEEAKADAPADTPGFIKQTFDRGHAWLATHRSEPFFLFLHTYQVHSPYDPPQETAQLFPIATDAAEPIRDAANYDREIRYTDSQVAKLIRDIAAAGVLDSSIVVVTSDHGEEFGEHGRRAHGTNLHEEVLRVPLLVRAPGALPAGVRRSGPMALIDLVPTLTSLLGLKIPATDGQNLAAQLIEGAATNPTAIYHEAYATAAMTYTGTAESWLPPSFALTTWPRRLIRIRTADGARYESYDLARDPAEKHDIYSRNKRSLGFLRARLDRYEEFRSQRRQDLALELKAKLGTVQPPTKPDERHQEKLRALGYLQ